MLPFILPALHALDQKLHLYLIVFLVSVFGFLRYVPLFWIPIDGLLVDFIIICVLICYISWYVDLSTVNFAFSHVAYWFVLRIGTVISVVLLNHRRRYILLVAMAYLYVLQGGNLPLFHQTFPIRPPAMWEISANGNICLLMRKVFCRWLQERPSGQKK